MNTAPQEVIVKKTLAEHAYEKLREQILDGELSAGMQLKVNELAKVLGVSSSPIREALVRLEQEKLITLELYCGYKVAEAPSPEYLGHLLDYRIFTEGHCALIGAARQAPDVITRLRAIVAKMGKTRVLGRRYSEYRDFISADASFHDLIVESAGNPVIHAAYRSIHPILIQSRLYRHRGKGESRVAEVGKEHLAVLEAFEAGDGERAKKALLDHLEGGRRRLLSASAEGKSHA